MKIKRPEFWFEAEKKLKKIWDILRDKEVVSFTLAVTLHRVGSNEPKIISMAGERSADGSWNTWFPSDRNSDGPKSPAILRKKLESIEEKVRKYIVENALDGNWKQQVTSIEEALRHGHSVDDLECRSEVPIRAIAAFGYEAHFCAPILATACVIEGTEALAKRDLEHASHCVDRGHYWSNADMFIPNPNKRYTERACTGGLKKDSRREPVKAKVAELLTSLAPKDGWESTPAAIQAVSKELTMNHSKFIEDRWLKTDNLVRTIGEWVKADPERFSCRIMSKS